jgi:hypothetical protein
MSRLAFGIASVMLGLGILPVRAEAQDRESEQAAVGRLEVRPIGIQIQRTVPAPADSTRRQSLVPAFRSYGGVLGGRSTGLALMVTDPSGGLVSVQEDWCTITEFADDTGRDLLSDAREAGGGRRSVVLRPAGRAMGPNREVISLLAGVAAVPDPAATSISVAGTIGLERNTGVDSHEHLLRLNEQNEFELAGLNIRWTPESDPVSAGWEDMPSGRRGTLVISGPNDAHHSIESRRFVEEDGDPVPAHQGSVTSRGGPGPGSMTVSFPYSLRTEALAIRFVISARRTVLLPFSVTVALSGVGLGDETSASPVVPIPPEDVQHPAPPPVGQIKAGQTPEEVAEAVLAAVVRRDYDFLVGAVTRATLEAARTSSLVRMLTMMGATPEEELEALPNEELLARALAYRDPWRMLSTMGPDLEMHEDREIIGVALDGDSRAYVTFRITMSMREQEPNIGFGVMILRLEGGEWRLTQPELLFERVG